jgi:hypothetical protein
MRELIGALSISFQTLLIMQTDVQIEGLERPLLNHLFRRISFITFGIAYPTHTI